MADGILLLMAPFVARRYDFKSKTPFVDPYFFWTFPSDFWHKAVKGNRAMEFVIKLSLLVSLVGFAIVSVMVVRVI